MVETAIELNNFFNQFEWFPLSPTQLILDNKLDWSKNIDHLYRKSPSRLYFLRRLHLFNICSKFLQMLYQSVVTSILFYAMVCWGSSTMKRDATRLNNQLIRRASSMIAMVFVHSN